MTRVILDFPDRPRQWFHEPLRIIEAWTLDQVMPALRQVQDAASGRRQVVGYVAYEAAPAFDAALQTRHPADGLPLVWFGVFEEPSPATPTAAHGSGTAGEPAAGEAATPAEAMDWTTGTGRDDYGTAIAEIRRRIAAGDVYQVNHTLRFTACADVSPEAVYEELVRARHGRYHAFIRHGEWAVVSASPELFFHLAADGSITTRPMKGTSRRGRWLEEDREAAAALAQSAKDRAENLMIVDLLRNDLGRVARFGSVRVPNLFEVETYPTVHQLTSTITARLRPDAGLCDVLAATFPCGSVTGAPKVTAMRTIAALEETPRGVYCGAVGVVRGDGSATFNVAIRTVTMRQGRAVYGSGGGITWDSQPDAEYDEVVAKAALLRERMPSFHLLETMRLEDGVIHRLQRHLRRLASSAAYWSFADDVAERAAALLADTAAAHPAGSHRLRLTAGRDGHVEVSVSELRQGFRDMEAAGGAAMRSSGCSATAATGAASRPTDPDAAGVPCAIARRPVSAANRLLHHKTTARHIYDRQRADFPDAFDVLLYNEQGRITEFTFGNVVACIDDRLLTPPRQDGLLAGTYRQQLLDTGIITEAAITRDDLQRASALFHINSVRGATRVRWAP
jgi:para-aminobenzoate synthetase / 4-amino-4-deoxychorismate lyase